MLSPRRSSSLVRSLYPRTLLLFQENFDWRITGRWMLYSVLVGAVGAFAAILFAHMVDLSSDFFMGELAGNVVPIPGGEAPDDYNFSLERSLNPLRRWLIPILPVIGGLLSGWVVYRFAPDAQGAGTDAVIRAFHRENSVINARVPLVKGVASALTIGSGGSAGREGPIAQIGAALATLIAQKLHLSDRERRILLVAGIAAGISSIFRSPLGGAFFAVEVLYREDLEAEALMPAVVAGITGYSIYSSLEGSSTVFTTPEFAFVNPLELLPLILFALVCAVTGIFFVRVFEGTRRAFNRLSVPLVLKPALGGLAVGCMAFFFPPILGSSYGWLQQAIDGSLPLALMASLVLLKIVATSLTIGSGGSGGDFAPSIVIGGMLGGIFGEGLHRLIPVLGTQPEAYVMIGMATFLSGVANVPIATTVMISEMTGSYTLLVPLLLAGVLTHIITRKWSIYPEQVRTSNESPAHRLDLTPDLLSSVRLRSVIEHPVYFHTLEPSHTLSEMLDVFARTREVILPVAEPVTDGQQKDPPRYTGLVLLDDVQSLLRSGSTLQHLIVAHDVQVQFASVSLEDTLDKVLDKFLQTQYPELPVLDEKGVIVGFVRQGQVISEYYRAYVRRKAEEQENIG